MDYQDICNFLYKEARYLDDRQWDEWLECYDEEVEYWMPSWRDDDQPSENPRTEVSLIYYPNKNGLVDRVFRIKTERSSASTPEPRTSHNLSNIEVLNQDGDEAEVRYNFLTMNHRYRETDSFFGTTYVTLSKASGEIKITKKKIVLKNDYIRQVIDVYHI